MAFVINSPAFGDGDPIPRRYAAEGENLSPPLTWQDPPPRTESFVLVLDDPDAPNGVFRHWAIFDIPAGRTDLPEGAGSAAIEPARHARNDYGREGYDGPTAPEGQGRHNYHFRLIAVGRPRLPVGQNATAAEVLAAARAAAVGEAELVGIYGQSATGATAPRQEAAEDAAEDRYRRPPRPVPTEPVLRQTPSKGDPVIVAGDAGGPGDGRNITTADIDHDAGKPQPNRLEENVFAADRPTSASEK